VREAYGFYVALLPTLDVNDPFTRAWVVYDRIREMEEELGIPPAERYRGTRPPVAEF
jgi:hypothetical protein